MHIVKIAIQMKLFKPNEDAFWYHNHKRFFERPVLEVHIEIMSYLRLRSDKIYSPAVSNALMVNF